MIARRPEMKEEEGIVRLENTGRNEKIRRREEDDI